jgi:hypothetical protein
VRRNVTLAGVLAALLLLAGCAHGSPPLAAPLTRPPVLPANTIRHADTESELLTVARVTSGALDAEGLTALLQRTRYLGGSERTFVSKTQPLDRVDTRVLEFSRADGATTYLRWVCDHPADLIGDVGRSSPLEAPGSVELFVHTPDGCCPKDVPKSLAVWQRDRYVLLVIANGGMAKQNTLTGLASQLDALV